VGPLRIEDEEVQVQLRREVIELENSTELLRFRGTQDARLQRYSELELHHRPSAVLLDHLPLNLRIEWDWLKDPPRTERRRVSASPRFGGQEGAKWRFASAVQSL
jgi:hypothetical protein